MLRRSIATMSFAGYFLVRSLLSSFPAYLRTFFQFDFIWFRLSVQECILANFFARFARSFIYAPGLSMGSEPGLAWADERSRRPCAPGEKASADLKKLQQILTMVQLTSNLRDNRSRIRKLKYSRAPRSGTCVPNLGPTSPTPLHSRSQRSKHR